MIAVHLGKGLDVDAHDLATSVWAAIGARGSGKTNDAGVIAEQLLGVKIPVVILDPVGPWFSLRLARDGKPSPFQIPVMGGDHGDIPLLEGSGRQVAEALAASNSSAVLDISMMSLAGRVRFSADFAAGFFEAKKRHRSPVCVIAEEAQRVAPQIQRYSDPNIARCLGSWEQMIEIGRNYGIGVGLISQRPQKINKDVLNLAETLFAHRLLGTHERKAISDWVQEKGAQGRGEVAGELPSLARGTAIVWSPGLFKVYGQFEMALKSTYDASATPDKARAAVTTKRLDLGALEAAMGSAAEEARRNDPAVLRADIADLRRQLAAATKAAPAAAPKVTEKIVDRPVMKASDVNRIVGALNSCQVAHERAIKAAHDILGVHVPISALVKTATEALEAQARPIRELHTGFTMVKAPTFASGGGGGHGSAAGVAAMGGGVGGEARGSAAGALPAGEARVLTAILQHPEGVTRDQLSILVGLKRTTRDLYLQHLVRDGLVSKVGETFTPTAAARGALPSFQPLPTGSDLANYWLDKLPGGEARLFRAVYHAGEGLTRDEAGAAVNLKRTTRDLYVQHLIARRLVEQRDGRLFAAAELYG